MESDGWGMSYQSEPMCGGCFNIIDLIKFMIVLLLGFFMGRYA